MTEQNDDNVVEITAGGRTVRGNQAKVLGALAAAGAPAFGELAPEGEGYRLSDEVKAVVTAVLRQKRFEHVLTERVRLGCALQVGKKPEGKGGMHVLARAVKAPALWRDLGDFEVVLWANEEAWQHLAERQREALIAHELCHVGMRNDKGTVTMLEHDIEEFGWVVREYGQWHQGLAFFAEQLGLGLEPGQAAP